MRKLYRRIQNSTISLKRVLLEGKLNGFEWFIHHLHGTGGNGLVEYCWLSAVPALKDTASVKLIQLKIKRRWEQKYTIVESGPVRGFLPVQGGSCFSFFIYKENRVELTYTADKLWPVSVETDSIFAPVL